MPSVIELGIGFFEIEGWDADLLGDEEFAVDEFGSDCHNNRDIHLSGWLLTRIR